MSKKQFTVKLETLGWQLQPSFSLRLVVMTSLFLLFVSPICCMASFILPLSERVNSAIRTLPLLAIPMLLVAAIWWLLRNRRSFVVVFDDDDIYLETKTSKG